ncbi:hypothetical protein KY290_037018 [Solanum tuberosum]|uniref:Uncharacterized protein n=1 Tax=Solanum tuberosum TaxID=4113 RepID=A0ABQ7TV29_SOLTU|nr:hypothetical protein KY289_036510 [Solanum tuberosum]KAH0738313.1 hypothetical protein KY290_037018 [Solanum tuberosum]
MSNSSSSSNLPVPLEIENHCSFNFSTPFPEESPSTPVCDAGVTGESTTPLTEVVASPILLSGEFLPCSPTLVLSGEKSQNSEAQSVVKPSVDPLTKKVEVPHSMQPVFDQTPKSFDVESEKEEEDEGPLRWSRKGVRGTNTLTAGVLDLETFKSVPETDLTNEPAEFAKERKRKRK